MYHNITYFERRFNMNQRSTDFGGGRRAEVCQALVDNRHLFTGRGNAVTIEFLNSLLRRKAELSDSYVKGNFPSIRLVIPLLRENGWGFYSCQKGIFYSERPADRDEFVCDQLQRASGLNKSAQVALNIPVR
jgi:hypothetical protein